MRAVLDFGIAGRRCEALISMEKIIANALKVTLALALATPLIVMAKPLPAIMFPYVAGKAIYFRLLVDIALVLWLPLLLWRPAYRPPRSWLWGILGAYFAIALLASLTGVSVVRSLWSNYERMQGWFGLVHFGAFTLMLASNFRTYREWRILFNVNLLIGLLVALLGILEMATGEPQRIGSSLGNPAFLGAYALVQALVAAGFLAHALTTPHTGLTGNAPRAKRRRYRRRGRPHYRIFKESFLRAFWVVAIVLNLFMVYQSGTRGAIVGLAAGLGLCLIGYAVWGCLRPVRIASATVTIVGIALVGGFLLLQNSSLFLTLTERNLTLQRLADLSLDDSSVLSRLHSVFAGFEGFRARPFLGWGPENYSVAYDLYLSESAGATSIALNFDQAHNRVVEELVTTGLLGLASYLAIWFWAAWVLLRKIRILSPPTQLLIMLFAAALAGYFVQNLFLFDTPGTLVQIYLLIGFIFFLEATPTQNAFDPDYVPSQAEAPTIGILDRLVFTHAWSRFLATGVAGAVTICFFYFTVVGPYTGLRTAYLAMTGERTWQERFELLDNAIEAAPWLANQPTLVFLGGAFDEWSNLSEEERQLTLGLAQEVGETVLKREPLEWRAHYIQARIYQKASLADPAFVPLARTNTDRASALAPHRLEVLQLQALQYVHENDVESALDVIDGYLIRNAEVVNEQSRAYRQLTRLRNEITGSE